MFFQAVNVSLDRVADVGYRFLPRFALRNTSWQRGAFGHKHAVLIRLNRYSEFHANESNAFPKGRKRVDGLQPTVIRQLEASFYGPLEEPHKSRKCCNFAFTPR